MLFTVTLSGSDRVFNASGEHSLLQAALSAGIGAPYGCASGTCGKCLVYVERGDVRSIAHSDYMIGTAERDAGAVLACSVAPSSDLVVRLAAASQPGDIELQTLTGRFYRSSLINDDVMSVCVKTSRARSMRYLSGQQVNVEFPIVGRVKLPIASCPCEGRELTFFLLRESHPELFSLVETMRRGDTLKLEGPLGNFVLGEPERKGIALICTDTGYPAVDSLLAQIINIEFEGYVMLIRITDRDEPPYLDNYCRSLRDALDDSHYCRVHRATGAGAVLTVLDNFELWEASNSIVRLALPDAPQVENELATELRRLGADVVCF